MWFVYEANCAHAEGEGLLSQTSLKAENCARKEEEEQEGGEVVALLRRDRKSSGQEHPSGLGIGGVHVAPEQVN